MENKERRTNKDRRAGAERRSFNDPGYTGHECRSKLYRRWEKYRRTIDIKIKSE